MKDYRLLILPTNCLRIGNFHVIKNADQRPALSLKYLQRTFVCKYHFRVAVNVEICVIRPIYGGFIYIVFCHTQLEHGQLSSLCSVGKLTATLDGISMGYNMLF